MVNSGDFIPADKLKDFLNKQTSISTGKPIDVVEKVMSFAFKDAKEQLKDHNEVILAGWGTLRVSLPKLRRKLTNHYIALDRANLRLKTQLSDEDRLMVEKKAIGIQRTIDLLEIRFNKFPTNED